MERIVPAITKRDKKTIKWIHDQTILDKIVRRIKKMKLRLTRHLARREVSKWLPSLM